MFMPFDYYDPSTQSEFIQLMQELDSYSILAGGTDLLVKMRNGWKPAKNVIDLKKISDCPEMHEIKTDKNGIYLGALVTFSEIKEYPVIKEHFTALYEACCVMGCKEIRNRATIGGNICNAASGAEGGTPLLAFDTIVIIKEQKGTRKIPLVDFYQMKQTSSGHKRPGTALTKGEFVSHFFLPFLPKDSSSTYLRRSRSQGMDLASLSLTLVLCHALTPQQSQLRIAAGAVAPLPRRFSEVEQKSVGKASTPDFLAETKYYLSQKITPRPSSKRASASYKKDQLAELFEEALLKLTSH